MRHVRRIINFALWTVVAVVVAAIVLLNIPSVQTALAQRAATTLSAQIGTDVHIGRIDMGLLHRLIIDDIVISDEDGDTLLSAQRLSATVRLRDLLRGKITLSAAQIFALHADLHKDEGATRSNFQFLLDAFASDDDSESKPLSLRINSLIIRRSSVAYNDYNVPDAGTLSPQHINLRGISGHILVKSLSPDSLNVHIRRLAMADDSGATLHRLSLSCTAGTTGATLSDCEIALGTSQIHLAGSATYSLRRDSTTHLDNLHYTLNIDNSALLFSDLHLLPASSDIAASPLLLALAVEGDNDNAQIHTLSLRDSSDDFALTTTARAHRADSIWQWTVDIADLHTTYTGIENVIHSIGLSPTLPAFLTQLDHSTLTATAEGVGTDILALHADLSSSLGAVAVIAEQRGTTIEGTLRGDSIALGVLTSSPDFGATSFAATFSADHEGTTLTAGALSLSLTAGTYRDYCYHDGTLALTYGRDKTLALALNLQDDNGSVAVDMESKAFLPRYLSAANLSSSAPIIPATTFSVSVDSLCPAALHLTDRWDSSLFSGTIDGSISARGQDDMQCAVALRNLHKWSETSSYTCHTLLVDLLCGEKGTKRLACHSDFANIVVEGQFAFNTLLGTLLSPLTSRLPALPLPAATTKGDNHLALYASIDNSDFAYQLLGIPLVLREPAHIVAKFDDSTKTANISADAYAFTYNGRQYNDSYLIVAASSDTLRATAATQSTDGNGNSQQLSLSAKGYDDHIASTIAFDSKSRNHISGTLATSVDLSGTTDSGEHTYEVDILPSTLLVADTIWTVSPSHITYYDNYLNVDDVRISHDEQYITIAGHSQHEESDAILVSLHDVNVGYILDFINFHAVDFAGNATGQAQLVALFDNPYLGADLTVSNFHFEGGDLGTCTLAMSYDFGIGNINIDALCREEGWCSTSINGYVSPKNNNIDLTITAAGSNLSFVETYCQDFATIPYAQGWGTINVVGPLKNINILGSTTVSADVNILATNVPYHLDHQRVRFIENDIVFDNDTLRDDRGGQGILSGHLPHDHLRGISFDMTVSASNLLALDIKDFGEDTFLGTVYATGSCRLRDDNGATVITVDVTPADGSFLTYDATAPDRVSDTFVQWRDVTAQSTSSDSRDSTTPSAAPYTALSDLYINIVARCEQNAELRVLMDAHTGDMITLHGTGVITAAYYNKGTFALYGNYTVADGTYSMTIQDVVKRDFTFKEGGTISFAGDATQAQLNMQATYSLASVPLSDINIGGMFANTNVPVDCLMNISGTPNNPQVDFALDLPTIGADAKQMIMNMFTDNEELNQQVVYLIAVGRFLSQGANNSTTGTARYSQTSLAMQSILSGTVSQQINSLLENVIGSKQWDFGANISPGEEGFNDAEYEGLISGRMLNNRLLFNGQFGYRDNANATSSFIGDFDLRYLLTASGSLAVRIYNETNNRYFTKNTMNTQGISLIVKKDFSSWRDFWRRKKKPPTPTPTP